MRARPAHPSRRLLVVALAGVAFAGAAPASSFAKGNVYSVEIKGMAFGALPAKLRVGDTIKWVNADIFRHTATARDGSFNLDLAPKARGRVTLTKAGQIAFFCRYHPGMKGVLTVVR